VSPHTFHTTEIYANDAHRCTNIAYSHALLSHPKPALALFARASTLASQAAPSSQPSPPTSSAPLKLDIGPQQTKALNSQLTNLLHQYRGLVDLTNFSDNARIAAEKNMTSADPIVERLTEYPAAGVDVKNLVTWPPKLKPVPVKPLFFDVAWNYVQYPGQEPVDVDVEKPAGMVEKVVNAVNGAKEEAPKKKKGWFGFGS